MVQTTTRTRKQRTEAAIAYALERRWDLAADENRALIEQQPEDIEAANRLGKALTELDDRAGAITAYRRSLEIDPGNAIARKNIARLEAEAPAARGKAAAGGKTNGRARKSGGGEAIRPDALIEESGKSAIFELHRPNPRATQRLAAGDPVQLAPSEEHASMAVRSSSRALLGYIEPRAGQRLRRLMEGGNRYEAAIRTIGDGTVAVIVRETYRHPSLLDEASFLRPAPDRRKATPRAYTRSSVVQREPGDYALTDDEDADEADPWSTSGAPSQKTEMADAGFGEAGPDDDDDDDEPEAARAAASDDDDDDVNSDDDEVEDDDIKAELQSEFGKGETDEADEPEDTGDENDERVHNEDR
ncbi:MAG: hypothetical protein O2895_02490 [Chloroflexi bacterium]|nr:hypothetical protein [Chloroflexota bacterium]